MGGGEEDWLTWPRCAQSLARKMYGTRTFQQILLSSGLFRSCPSAIQSEFVNALLKFILV